MMIGARAEKGLCTSPATCPLCSSIQCGLWAESWDTEYRTTDDRFSYFHCPACEILFIHPMPVERLQEIYPANYNSFSVKSSFANRVKNWLDERFFRSLVSGMPGETLSALDVGGGYGLQLDALRRIEPRVKNTIVIDIDRTAEAEATSKGHRYINCRIEDFDGTLECNFIFLLNLIEHVENPLKVLEAARSMLSPQGIILVKTPNFDSLDARVFRHKNWSGLHCPRHWILFNRRSFTALAGKAGLHVKKFSYTQGAPFWTQSTLAWLSAHGFVKISPERPTNNHFLFPVLSAAFAALDFLRRPFSKTSQMFFVLEHKH